MVKPELLKQFSVAFSAAPGATLVADPDGRILLTNNAMDKLFEYDEGDLVGSQIECLVPDEFRQGHPELRKAFMSMAAGRALGSGRELCGVTKSGARIPVEIGLNRVTADSYDYVVASVLDISARIKDKDRTRLAIDAAASAMIMTDSAGTIVLANELTYDIFGYDAHELIGSPIETLIPETLRRKHSVYRNSYAAEPSKRTMGPGRELNGRRKDGSEFPLEIGLTPIDDDGELFTMATISDVSERKMIEAQIRKKNEDLTRLNDELAQFSYSASHDLKAPLASIEGLLGCVEEDLEDDDAEAARDNTARAKSMAHALRVLIEKILGLAKADHLQEETEPVDIARCLADARDLVRELAAEREVRIEVEVDAELIVESQPTRIKQTFDNLINNAVKYADRNKSERHVHIRAMERGADVEIVVADNGIGIPKDEQEKMFGLFARSSNHDEPGTGLGLALIRRHVDRVGGAIKFDSSPDGTTFKIHLPKVMRQAV